MKLKRWKHWKYLRREFRSDRRKFFSVLNPYTHFSDFWKGFKTIFLLLFFPYIIMIWYAIRLYRYFYIYIFLILDIVFFDIIRNKWIIKLYKLFYRVTFYLFYYPIFILFPIVYQWTLHKLSLEFWLGNIFFILNLVVDVIVYFLYKLLFFIMWLDRIDDTYRNIRFYWVMRRDLIWGFKYKRRLKRKKKEEIRQRKREERAIIREAWVSWLKSLREQFVIKMIDLIISFYDKIWLVIRWYYFYKIYYNILKGMKYFSLLSKDLLYINWDFYYWKIFEFHRYLHFKFSGRLNYNYFKLFILFIYSKYLRLREIFNLYNIFRWLWRIYFIICNSTEFYYLGVALIFIIILILIFGVI